MTEGEVGESGFGTLELTSRAGMRDGDTFSSRVDTERTRDGVYAGQVIIEVKPGSDEQARVQALQDECDRLRDRVAELESLLNV